MVSVFIVEGSPTMAPQRLGTIFQLACCLGATRTPFPMTADNPHKAETATKSIEDC